MDDFHEKLPMKGKSPMMVSMMVPQKSWMGWMGGWMVHGKSQAKMEDFRGKAHIFEWKPHIFLSLTVVICDNS